ncbi:efflux RND transporter permease subunit [Flavihumibacter profundi]|uniref:efflux RND transporter permease subunit n=1 Tax=Flavihumibacter profundi TaxID=2716883 RepID=UPI001CC4AD5E|nr:multidrug efflux RND transporter permease subunit [Flavihumibacter profundi]MBZ5858219.1 multidrug efflux RND transporter permease subunit [Flavihumibacter profundi]
MSEFFIRRPIVAMVISIFIILLGLLTLRKIPIAQYPEIVPPMIKITGTYNGANAVNVEQTTATPIEQQVNGVEEMLYMQSINANDGTTTIQVSFEVGTNLDNANMLTQNRVAMANPFLPADVKNMGVNTKKALSFPLVLVSVYSPKNSYDAQFVSNYVYINILDQIKRIKGVGDVTVFGGAEYAMRVWLKPDKMTSLGITVNDVKNSLNEYNNIFPGGSFGNNPALPGVQNTYTAQLQARLVSPEEFGKIILKSNTSGAVVRLSDIARIELGTENYFQNSRLNGQTAATMAVYQIPGSNAIEVAESIRKVMEEMKERFPNDLNYRFSLDTTLPIEAGIEEILHTLFEAILLVILVVFIFLQDWRATLIPLLTVPVSLIGVFIFFPLLGFSVNVLSLLGLVLAIGLVVDDAIVVVEAVMHHIEHGLSPKEATQKAMKEVAGPVVAIAIILAAVFIPVAMTGGITGRLYQQFAITIAVSVLLSAFNALTLSPALAALILKPKKESNNLLAKFFRGFNKMFDKFTNGYMGIAGFFARKVVMSLLVLGIIVVTMVVLGKKVPGGFVPEEDNGYFIMGVILPDAASFERTDAVSKKVEALLKNVEGIESYTLINGFNILSNTVAPNTATVFVQLKKWDERSRTDKEIIREVNAITNREITDATVIAVGPPPIPGLGNASGFTLQLQDRAGNSPQFLSEQSQRFIAAARQRPEIGNIYTLYRSNVPQKSIEVDKEKVEKLGLQLSDVNSSISAMLGGVFVNNFNAFGRQYRTYVQADAPYRMKPNDLEQLFIRDAKGNMVSLATLAVVKDTTGPQYTNRFNLYRAAEISGSPAPGYSSAQALDALEEVAKSTLPNTMGYQWSNMSYQEKAASGQSASVFAMALLFVFLILAAQYESWKLPFSVLLGTPWAVMGAMLGLFLARMYSESYVNNVFAQIGLVMLIGLNAKNAILIVEFAKMKMEEGVPVLDAALDGARLRFRPILMTSFAFILGVVPLLTAAGAGAEARKVMGMAVFAGMITATVIGCILIPSFFVLIERSKKQKDKKVNSSPEPATNHEA